MKYLTSITTRPLMLLMFCVIGFKAIASTDPPVIKTLYGSKNQIKTDSFSVVSDEFYDASYIGKINTPFRVINIVTLRVNEDSMYFFTRNFGTTVNVRIYLTRPDNVVDSVDKQFSINYRTDSVYNNRSYFVDSGAHSVKIKVLSTTDTAGMLPSLVLENEMIASPDYIFGCNLSYQVQQSINVPAIADTADEIKVNWSFRTGVDEYDLEWAYIDSSALGRYNDNPALIFDNNATRISTASINYSIPLMYGNGGVLYARVRSVQVKSDGTRIASGWSTNYLPQGLGKQPFAGHQRNLNWQSSVTYAEGGKRKVVVQYYDGSLRSRQTVTKDNSISKTVVAETYYDFQGRPVIQVLPAPTLKTVIQFSKNFNALNSNGDEYYKGAYDTLVAPSAYCGTGAPAMDSTSTGASYYYSSNSFMANTTFSGFTPLGQGYVFTETEYTQDNTGRISRQSGVGPIFQLGSGHEAKYYYGSPDQTELDALFGTEVGNKTHYFKNMVRDANGQLSVSYVDMHGRTIATALAGSLPDSVKLDTLGSFSTSSITESLTDSSSTITKGLVIQSQKSLLVSTPGNYQFKYDLGPQALKEATCAGDTVCYSCLYNLEITITDDCNNQKLPNQKAYDTTVSNFSILNFNANGCAADTGFHVQFSLGLDVGNYEITKKLSLSQYGKDRYRDSVYLKKNVCTTVQQYVQQQMLSQNRTNCQPSCQACSDSLGTWQSFRSKFMQQTGVSNADSASYRDQALTAYQNALNACAALCDTANGNNDDIRKAMLADVSAPSGQYATIGRVDTFSVLYPRTIAGIVQPPYYTQATTYVDDNGHADSVYNDSTGKFVSPQQLDAAQFSNKFRASWATALLPFHPEYCKLSTYDQFAGSLHWDKKFKKVDAFDTASAKGYLNPTANTTTSPFNSYTAVAANKDSLAIKSTQLKDSLEYYLTHYKTITISGTAYNVSLYTFATMAIKCGSDNACQADFITHGRAFEALSCGGERDLSWQTFSDMYLQVKAGILYNQVKNASCSGRTAPSSQTLVNAGHTPNFNNAQDALAQSGIGYYATSSDTTALKDSAKTSLHNYYVDNSEAYANLWVQQLAPCVYYDSAALYGTIIPQLKTVCLKGSDINHPYGSRDISPDSAYAFANFDSVLTRYNRAHGITDVKNCNADLILMPKPYNQQLVYGNKPVINKPSTCECTRINDLYTEFTTNATSADTSFSAYLKRQYHTTMSQADLNKLRSLCADTSSCKFVSKPIQLPPVLQCYSGDVCVTCNAVSTLYNQFVARYDTVPVVVTAADTVSYQRVNQLFANFMNNKLGFSKQAWEYLSFLSKCSQASSKLGSGMVLNNINVGLGGGTNNFETAAASSVPLNCSSCDNLQQYITAYFDTLTQGPGSEAEMLTYVKSRLATNGLTTTTAEIKQALTNCHNGWLQNLAYNNQRGVDAYFLDTPSLRIGRYGAPFSIELRASFSSKVQGPTNNPYYGMQAIITTATTNFFDTSWRQGFTGYRFYWQLGQLYFQMGDGSARHNQGGSVWVRTVNTFTPDQWHHIVVTRSGNDSSGIKIYVDSVLQNTQTIEGCNHLNTGNVNGVLNMLLSNMTFSGGWGQVSLFFNHLRLYGRVLAGTEVKTNFIDCTGNPADTTNMRLWAKLNEGGGLPYDYSQYHTKGAWHGSATPKSWWGGRGPAVCPACLVHNSSAVCNYPVADTLLLCGKSDPVFAPDTSQQVTCCTDSTFFAQSIGTERYRVVTDSVKNTFNSDYNQKCLKAINYERFTVTHNVSEYHYTLYYYDQAGNLLKTVPPAGVKGAWRQSWYDSVKAARATGTALVPPHILVTQYRYNSLNQVVAQQTPDAGKSLFWYDRLGRLAISQNAKQQLVNKYSYTEYDYLGRIKQVGEITSATAMAVATSRNEAALLAWISNAATTKVQITQTVYDVAYSPLSPVMQAKNLRNRVAYTALYNSSGAIDSLNHTAATFYSYDIHGNVDTLIQDYKSGIMAANNNRFKKVVYQYDLISGKVNWVGYQPGQADAFYHRYTYDAENRITNVETSADSVVWENDASYAYYRHGPLGRLILGDQQVQGVDYAYTIQGWLKGINGTYMGVVGSTISGDGSSGIGRLHVARDAYGLALYYYKNDYLGISYPSLPTRTFGNASLAAGFKPLYNGNIAAMDVVLPKLNSTTGMLYTYRYDQLNRLTGMAAYGVNTTTTATWNPISYKGYQEKVSYDANGNILTYNRYGNGTTTASIMDSLTYGYYPNTNRLDSVGDKVADNAFADDIDNQAAHNYTYDAIGNLTKDKKNGVDSIYWNVYGKITQVVKKDTTTITYTYDAAGNRISKTVHTPLGDKGTWYVRDGSGNVMSVYTTGDNTVNSGQLTQTEVHLYGSSRLGIYRPNVNVQNIAAASTTALPGLGYGYNYVFYRGKKFFEVSNHLGNVLATVSDRKVGVDDGVYSVGGTQTSTTPDGKIDYYVADVVSEQDYYPFGMLEPGRQYNAAGSSAYRYGFNGKEKSDEIEGVGVDYDYGFRIYDARIGRFLSVDPLQTKFPFFTPYQFSGNTPIQAVDLDGREQFHYTMTTDNQGNSVLKLIYVRYTRAHSFLGFNWTTKYGSKMYRVDFDGKSYYIGYGQYGKGYANAWLSDDFENNFIKKQGLSVDFVNKYADENTSWNASNINQAIDIQNKALENSIPIGTAEESEHSPTQTAKTTAKAANNGNNEAENNTGTVYRTQGGQLPNASQERIIINSGGDISIKGDEMLYVTVNDKNHAIYFYNKRGGIDKGASIVSFEVPKSLIDDIEKNAVPQAQGKAFPNAPQASDVTKSKSVYGLPKNYIQKLQQQAIKGSGKVETPK